MGKRVRLTDRRRASDETPYPGTVNQEDRKFVDFDKYHTFEQTVNYELPDMRTEWRNDSRDEIGFPIAEDHVQTGIEDEGQKVASYAAVRSAASKAVRLSMLLLGNKVPERMIEAQAKDFMRLGAEGIDRALARFAETESIYSAEEDDKKEEAPVAKKGAEEDEKKEEGEKKEAAKKDLPPEFLENIKKKEDGASDKKEEEAPKAKKGADEAPVEDKKEEAPVAKKGADETPVEDKKEEAPKAKKSADEAPVEDKKEEAPVAKKGADEAPAEDKKEEEAPKAKKSAIAVEENRTAELDIDMTAGGEDAPAEDEESEKILSSLFEEVKRQGAKKSGEEGEVEEGEEGEAEEPKARSASSRGVQKLGGQPRSMVASNMSVNDLSSIWGDVPDVSGLFE